MSSIDRTLPQHPGEGDGLTAADRLKYTEAFNIFDKHQQLGRKMYGDVGGLFWGGDRFPEKMGMFEDVRKKQMWTKKPLGDVWYVFVWQIFWGGYGIWNRVFSPISYSGR